MRRLYKIGFKAQPKPIIKLGRGSKLFEKRQSKITKFQKKNRSPVYALTILGKILYRRLKRSSLITKGINLVNNVSSCSLLDWSDRLLNSTHSLAKKQYCKMPYHEKEPPGLLPATTSFLKESIDANSNVNARITSGTRQDVEQDVASRAEASTCSNHLRCARRKLRRPGRHRGLVARSIGKPKTREHKRMGNINLKKKKKLRARNALINKLQMKSMSKPIDIENTTCVNILDRSVPPTSPNVADRLNDISSRQSLASWTEASGSKIKKVDVPVARQCAAATKASKRKSHKWRTLIKLGNTVLARHVSMQAATQKRKRWEKRAIEQKGKKDEVSSHNAIKTSVPSSQVQSKDLSPENSEWPELSVSGRTRAHAKETATEIVKSKHSASATKTTRKMCIDNGPKRNKDLVSTANNQQLKDKRKPEAGMGSQKTWASVAAAGTVQHGSVVNKTPDINVTEQGEETSTAITPSGSGNQKRKRKRANYRLAQTDKIWLTCQKSKGNPYTQNNYRKNCGDRKDKALKRKNVSKSPSKKIFSEKQYERFHNRKQTITPRDGACISQASIDNCSKKSFSSQGIYLKCTSSDRDCQGQNACLVDNMPEVYTKRAGKVITLEESSHDRPTYKNVNKCNNENHRTKNGKSNAGYEEIQVTSVKRGEQPDVSGTDLCSQMSSMTFQTPTTSNCAFTRESFHPRKSTDNKHLQEQCSTAKTLAEGGGVPTKQKKISLRYRALCRDGCGPLDARTVSDIHTRHRRTDSLHDNKVVTRALRRRHRAEHQNTAYSSRRQPVASDNNDATQCSENTSSTNRPRLRSDLAVAQSGKAQEGGGSRANRRSNPRKTAASQVDEAKSSQKTSTSRNIRQVETDSGTSSDSSGESVDWRPDGNTGANNSQNHHDSDELGNVTAPILMNLRRRAIDDVPSPESVTRGIRLPQRQNRNKVKPSSSSHALDMNWK